MSYLGIDIGSSSIKVSVVDDLGKEIKSVFNPKEEMTIDSPQSGWAEQNPEMWIKYIKECLLELSESTNLKLIKAIGVTYQMHGLVCIDENSNVLRPSIIWCDSRAVEIGKDYEKNFDSEKTLNTNLNLPGNFTLSKLKWIKENEPNIYKKIYKFFLPGDYVVWRLTGQITTTAQGLSEAIAWDFKENKLSNNLFEELGLDTNMVPKIVNCFTDEISVSKEASEEFGLSTEAKVSYRSGDQTNNALSLGGINVGDFVATAGTSGVIYGITDKLKYDKKSRVNVFLHANNSPKSPKLGILMCINGCGILNSWAKNIFGANSITYSQMNEMATKSPVGSNGINIIPFGNGVERIYENQKLDASINGIDLKVHTLNDIFRAVQEGIAFAFKDGLDIIKNDFKAEPSAIHVAKSNLFLSKVFAQTIADISNVPIHLHDTNSSVGAAKAAAFGIGNIESLEKAFSNSTDKIEIVNPIKENSEILELAYKQWKKILLNNLNQ